MIKFEKHRKQVAIGISILTTILTFVSISASYSTYLEGFRDWGPFGRVLAVAVTAGVEFAFALLVYGIVYAFIGIEFMLAVIGSLSFLIIMAINFSIHTSKVKGISLSSWQLQYEQFVGSIVPFYAIALLLFIGSSMFEARERRQQRRIAYLSKQRALEFKEDYLNSDELVRELEPMKPQIADDVKRQMQLPAIAQSNRRPGFSSRVVEMNDLDDNPKA